LVIPPTIAMRPVLSSPLHDTLRRYQPGAWRDYGGAIVGRCCSRWSFGGRRACSVHRSGGIGHAHTAKSETHPNRARHIAGIGLAAAQTSVQRCGSFTSDRFSLSPRHSPDYRMRTGTDANRDRVRRQVSTRRVHTWTDGPTSRCSCRRFAARDRWHFGTCFRANRHRSVLVRRS